MPSPGVRLGGYAMFALSAGRAFAGDEPHSLDVWIWHMSAIFCNATSRPQSEVERAGRGHRRPGANDPDRTPDSSCPGRDGVVSLRFFQYLQKERDHLGERR